VTTNRRDFLLFRTPAGRRVLELSCERLYMRCLDAQSASAIGRSDLLDGTPDFWEGEPPRIIDEPSIDDLFHDLERDLRDVDVLRLVDTQWLASERLNRRFGDIVGGFQRRGGLVEIP
jgi:hypothetical protein